MAWFTTEAESVDPADEPASYDDAGYDTRAITLDAPGPGGDAMHERSRSPVAAPPRPAESEWPPPAPQAAPPAASGPSAVAEPAWLAGKTATTNGVTRDELSSWEQATATHEPFSSDTPMEATAVDGDPLDDDAFFASLRDTVRDDERVGPIGEEPMPFFDDEELTDDRRRFRRRR